MALAKLADGRRYSVLGPVEARLDDQLLPVAPGKQTLLLAALLARPDQVVSADVLAHTLWGGRSSSATAGSLRALVSKLRKALTGESPVDTRFHDLLVSAAGGYRLRLTAGDEGGRAQQRLDAQTFGSLLAQARADRFAGRPVDAVDAYRSALSLWHGAAFSGAAGDGRVGGLVVGEARRLETERAVAIEERLAVELELGSTAELLGELEALVTAEPLRERPVELLMVAFYRMGRQQDALALYRRLRTVLDDELGVQPSASVRALHERLLRQDVTLSQSAPRIGPLPTGPSPTADRTPSATVRRRAVDTAGVAAGNSSDAPLPGNLPVASSDLVGREEALGKLLEMLARRRVVTLTGTAGVGKTSLAMSAARSIAHATPEHRERSGARFTDGVWLIELVPLAADDSVVDAVSGVLEVQQRPGVSVLTRLVEYLRSKRLLLVLDNVEHVIDAAAEMVAAIVRGCPHIVVLATSREPLGVDGEHLRPVSPLPVPPASCLDADAVRRSAAAELFVARAQAAVPDFALNDGNAGQIGEICRRLDGLPLAIELAANRMRSLGSGEVASGLEQRFHLLRDGPRTAASRHRTLRGAIDWSYELLDEQQRRTFEHLAVFAGRFTLQAAAWVMAASDTTIGELDQTVEETAVAVRLGGLVDRSMIVCEPGDGSTRYRLLETLRAYGRERLAARHELAPNRAHAAYFTAAVEVAAHRPDGADRHRFLEAIEQEKDDVRTAHVWALEHDLGNAVRLVAGLFRYVEHRLPTDVPLWAERTVEAVEVGQAGPVPLLPTVYGIAARGAARRGQLDRAKALATQGGAVGIGPTDASRRHPLYALAAIALFEGRLAEVGPLTIEVERLSLAADDAWFAVRAQTLRALALVYAGRSTAALAIAEDTRALAARSGDPAAIGWSHYLMGEALLEREPERAAALLEEALHAARSVDDRYLTGVAMVSAISVRARHGDPRQAASLFRDVIDHWQAADNWTQQWTTIRNVVELFVRTGCDEAGAMLLGSLDRSGTATPAFGTGAARLDAARRALEDRLGPGVFAMMTARGAAMGDVQALHIARNTLVRLAQQAPESRYPHRPDPRPTPDHDVPVGDQ